VLTEALTSKRLALNISLTRSDVLAFKSDSFVLLIHVRET
jgi:hypothetical protein